MAMMMVAIEYQLPVVGTGQTNIARVQDSRMTAFFGNPFFDAHRADDTPVPRLGIDVHHNDLKMPRAKEGHVVTIGQHGTGASERADGGR